MDALILALQPADGEKPPRPLPASWEPRPRVPRGLRQPEPRDATCAVMRDDSHLKIQMQHAGRLASGAPASSAAQGHGWRSVDSILPDAELRAAPPAPRLGAHRSHESRALSHSAPRAEPLGSPQRQLALPPSPSPPVLPCCGTKGAGEGRLGGTGGGGQSPRGPSSPKEPRPPGAESAVQMKGLVLTGQPRGRAQKPEPTGRGGGQRNNFPE